ncbi:hypothetical protein BpHYR1_013182, partial [Brachionus plicatilis]
KKKHYKLIILNFIINKRMMALDDTSQLATSKNKKHDLNKNRLEIKQNKLVEKDVCFLDVLHCRNLRIIFLT